MSSLHYSSVRLSDLDPLTEWDLGTVLKLGDTLDSIPAYRYSANEARDTHLLPSTTTLTPIAPLAVEFAHYINYHGESPLTILPTAFLSTLRTNIQLSTIDPSYQPYPTMSISAPPPPTTSAQSLTADLPTLSIYPTTTQSDRTSALHLVADSIAQQRQSASFSLITHPYPLSFTILVLGILCQYLDFATFATTAAGIIMILLLGVRMMTGGYISLAETINFTWLEGPAGLRVGGKKGHGRSPSGGASGNVDPAPLTKTNSGNVVSVGSGNGKRSRNNSNSSSRGEAKDVENIVVVSKWGEEEIIGALVMRVSRKEKKAVIRAWTVKLRYRGKGVGRGLLEECVRVAKERGCGRVEFEREHANSHKVLPDIFNKGFERREKRAKGVLVEVMKEQGVGR
ncbi:MAG: hypothetical protein L6R38_002663 [Xanthoria sp. 2 TBL-2021]|nr:MAG: hypothetical protein L6R38_002663 [Xanthoria sp. 2 TBL-2021]